MSGGQMWGLQLAPSVEADGGLFLPGRGMGLLRSPSQASQRLQRLCGCLSYAQGRCWAMPR